MREEFARLVEIVATLRSPEGCPWDREQTIDSLKPYVLEETYEVVEAIDRGDHAALREELGDFVFEAVFLAQLESEAGHFTIADSLTAIAERGLARETGARGLRSIIEEILLEVQFELPSRRDVKKCVVTKETVEKGLTPTLVTEAAPDEADELREESA